MFLHDINRDQQHTNNSPDNNENQPTAAAERTRKLITHPLSDDLGSLFPRVINQQRRYQILDTSSRVRTRNAHQYGQILRTHGYQVGRQDSEHGKSELAQAETVGLVGIEKEGLEIVSQGDGDDGETGAESEHGKKGEEVLDADDEGIVAGGAASGTKVQGVELVQVLEREDACEGQEEVEEGDEGKVQAEGSVELGFVGDGGDQGGQGVVTHEGVDADAKQSGEAQKRK